MGWLVQRYREAGSNGRYYPDSDDHPEGLHTYEKREQAAIKRYCERILGRQPKRGEQFSLHQVDDNEVIVGIKNTSFTLEPVE